MITHVTLVEATANIVQLLERVINGEEIIIFQAGQPIAHISPSKSDRKPRTPGQYVGKFVVPASFNDPLPDDIVNAFLDSADLH